MQLHPCCRLFSLLYTDCREYRHQRTIVVPSRYAVLFRLLLLASLSFTHFALPSEAQYTLRIGLIDFAGGSMLKGAQLAVRQINEAGGIRSADGSSFNLTVVHSPPDNMEIAIANMRQASAIAVIGPETGNLVDAYMSQLQALEVPIMTPATGDTVLLRDHTQQIVRARARASLTTGALADYLVNSLAVSNIRTVQLDAASTGDLISFANALSALGARLSNTFIDANDPDLDAHAQDIAASGADIVAIYGSPPLAAQVYNRIRAAGYLGDLVYDQAEDAAFADLVPTDALSGIIGSATWSPALPSAASQAFVLEFARAFGHLPDAIAAASYDATRALAAALPGASSVSENLASLPPFPGAQGELNSAGLVRGELSSNAVVTRLNEFGVPNVIAYYRGGAPVALRQLTYVETTPTPASTATPAPTPTPSGYTLTIQSAVQNVRSGPGLQFEVIGQLQRGTQARVLGATPDYAWLVIDFRGQWGWLASYLLATFGNRNLLPVIQPPATPTPGPNIHANAAAPTRPRCPPRQSAAADPRSTRCCECHPA